MGKLISNNEMLKLRKIYQCHGCLTGPKEGCFKTAKAGIGCDNHYPGTMVSNEGTIFVGLPKGFNRLGDSRTIRVSIFESIEQQQSHWPYDKFNVPVWKYKNAAGDIIIRGLCPRINQGFIHVIVKGDFDSIGCLAITDQDIKGMD
jgi:hypothetical protein